MSDDDFSKRDIRKRVAALLAAISSEDKLGQSLRVLEKIELLPEFVSSKVVMCYYSMPNELPTHQYIKRWSETKTVVLPRVDGDDLLLLKYNPDDMEEGKYGIFEPLLSCEKFNIADVDLVIVPGVAFDFNGNRLGHGKGYYDRLLSTSNVMKVGVALDCQIVETLPHCQHDIKMDLVLSATHTISNNHK